MDVYTLFLIYRYNLPGKDVCIAAFTVLVRTSIESNRITSLVCDVETRAALHI